jgi:hypothetical protein
MYKIVVSTIAALASCKDLYSHIEIHMNDGYVLQSEITDWLNSAKEDDVAVTRRVKVVENPGNEIPTPKLLFINSEGEPQETVFIEHIPLSMVKSLIKEKEWVDQ